MRSDTTTPLQYSITPYPLLDQVGFWTSFWRTNTELKSVNNPTREYVLLYMKKMFAILAVALLSPYAASQANAGPISEGPLHWTARHVRNATYTVVNVSRTAARTIHHRVEAVRDRSGED
jgi:hypothetical protein